MYLKISFAVCGDDSAVGELYENGTDDLFETQRFYVGAHTFENSTWQSEIGCYGSVKVAHVPTLVNVC